MRESSVTKELVNSISSTITRVTRSQNREVERIVHLKQFDGVSKRLGEFSDEDEVTEIQRKSDLREIGEAKKFSEYFGSFGSSLIILLIPLLTITFYVSCSVSECTFNKLPNLDKYKYLKTWFDLKTALIYLCYLNVLAFLTALPFGGRRVSGLPNKHGKLEYITNGLFSFTVIFSIVIGLQVKGFSSFNFLTEHLYHFMIMAILSGILFSVVAYVRSFYVGISALNVNCAGRSRVYGFFVGQEVNPRIFQVIDLKVFVSRLSIITAVRFLFKIKHRF